MNGGPRGPNALFLGTALFGALVVATLYRDQLPVRVGFDLDAFHHMASVRELARGEFPPRHNMVPGYTHQGHYGPYLVLLGVLTRLTGASSAAVLCAAGVVNLLLYVFAFRCLLRRLVGEGAGRWAALVPLLLWGPWPIGEMNWASLGWPGTTSLAEAYNFFYPNQAGLILVVAILALLASEPGPGAPKAIDARTGALALVATALLIATHPLSGVLLASALVALGISRLVMRRLGLSDAAWLAAIPAGALLLAALWPYYPVLKLLPVFSLPWFRTSGVAASRVAALFGGVPAIVAPALSLIDIFGLASFGLVGLLLLARRRRPFALLWFLTTLAVIVCPYVPLRHRFSLFAVIPLHVGAAALFEAAWQRGRAARTGVLAILACGALSALLRLDWALGREAVSLDFVTQATPAEAVILANPTLSNGVGGLTGRKVVCPQNPDLFLILAGGARRIQDVSRFLEEGRTTGERAAILKRWHATHVLIDRIEGGRSLAYPEVARSDGFILYDVREAAR